MTNFEGTSRRMAKMNVTFPVANEVLNTVFKFFPQKNPYGLT